MKNKQKNIKNEQTCKKVIVDGMHCASCKILVEKEFRHIKGIKNAKANIQTGVVEIEKDPQTSIALEELNSAVNSFGYHVEEFSPNAIAAAKTDIKCYILPFLLAITFAFIFDYFGKRYAGVSTITSDASYVSFFIFGLIAGISSCAAVIGGLLLGVSKKWAEQYGASLKPQILFLTSRTLTYFVLGGTLGVVGSAISLSTHLMEILVLLVSLLMIFLGLQMLSILPKKALPTVPKLSNLLHSVEHKNGKIVPVALGFLTFLLPCGFTLIAQASVLTMGSFSQAAFSMGAFALGTLPPLILVGTASTKLYANKKFSTQFSYFAGFLVIMLGFTSLNDHLSLLGLPSFGDAMHAFQKKEQNVQKNVQNGTQLMQMEASGLKYMPTEFSLALNIPVRWEIYNKGALGCANAVYAPGLYDEVVILKPGLNVVEFTPHEKGNYKISCSMGMVPPVHVTVN